ncbi:MAG: hypothetical protein U1E65_23765 [Myxococcota bacterium]
MNETAASIEAFVELTIQRLKGELPQVERARLESLEDQLRDQIDGARPAPRKIENPTAAPAQRPSVPVRAAQVVVTRSAPGARPDDDLRIEPAPAAPPARAPVRPSAPAATARPERLSLNEKDKAKLTEVPTTSLPRSGYTPSTSPLFLEDYYGETVVPDPSLGGAKASVVRAQGEAPQAEVKMLFGVSRVIEDAPPEPQRRASVEPDEMTEMRDGSEESTQYAAAAAASVAPPARPAPAAVARVPLESRAVPRPKEERAIGTIAAAVHLLAGGAKKGDLLSFTPDSGVILRTASGDERIEAAAIFVIFMGPPKGMAAAKPEGTRIAVKLTNDREMVGASPDYAPGAGAMTLIPDDRRSVDKIWIPAWSVAEIRFA